MAYYNTSLNGKGDRYPDPHSQFLAGKDSYLLLTIRRGGEMVVEIKSLQGQTLDRQDIPYLPDRRASRKESTSP